MGLPDASDSRLAALTRWVFDDLGFSGGQIAVASADASFRRYFRVTRGEDSYIVMDAPPDKEDVIPFVTVARMLAGWRLNVPIILAQDRARGFLLLSDLGSRQYLDELADERAADRLYGDAFAALARMQSAEGTGTHALPRYTDALLLREMDLMPEWFLGRHLGLKTTSEEKSMLQALEGALVQNALAQPQAFVHRDYHSRNLLVTEDQNPGILDFQDAVFGPATYDLVSLLKDCYIEWPAARVRAWALQYRERLLEQNFPLNASEAQFIRWFDLMGLQRHIKVLGIFCRLNYRDGKNNYLKDLPRVLRYTHEAAAAYEQTAAFAEFIEKRVDGEFLSAQERAIP